MRTVKETINLFNSEIVKYAGNSIKLHTEFTGERMEYPIKHIHISTGIYNLKAYFTKDENENLQKVKELTIEATVCAPKTVLGNELIGVVDAIVNAATSEDVQPIIEVHTGKASYNSTIGAVIQSVFVTVKL